MSKVTECDEPDKLNGTGDMPSFMEKIREDLGINEDLTVDVADLKFPNSVAQGVTCGNVQVVFVLTGESKSMIYDTKSRQVNIDCQKLANIGDVKIDVTYGSYDVRSIPTVEVGDRNPFGITSTVKVSFGNCGIPKTLACLYCGFNDNGAGVDTETWSQWQTQEVTSKLLRL